MLQSPDGQFIFAYWKLSSRASFSAFSVVELSGQSGLNGTAMNIVTKLILGLASSLLLCVGLTRYAGQFDPAALHVRAASQSTLTDGSPCVTPCQLRTNSDLRKVC